MFDCARSLFGENANVIVAVLSDQKVKKMSAKSGASANNFPIVCVGGSAGGLDAYIRLLDNLPADFGQNSVPAPRPAPPATRVILRFASPVRSDARVVHAVGSRLLRVTGPRHPGARARRFPADVLRPADAAMYLRTTRRNESMGRRLRIDLPRCGCAPATAHGGQALVDFKGAVIRFGLPKFHQKKFTTSVKTAP